MSVNVILFRGNQKNIRVGLSGRNDADSGLFTKKIVRFPDYQGEAQFLVTHAGCFPGVLCQICRGSKNFAFGLMAGKFGKFGLKAPFVSCAFIVRFAEASADHESPWM